MKVFSSYSSPVALSHHKIKYSSNSKAFLLLLVERGLSVSLSLSLSVKLFFSGLVVPETRGNETVPEVVTTSGYALLHFFSDAAYNLTGFTITYSYVLPLLICLCLSVPVCQVCLHTNLLTHIFNKSLLLFIFCRNHGSNYCLIMSKCVTTH